MVSNKIQLVFRDALYYIGCFFSFVISVLIKLGVDLMRFFCFTVSNEKNYN